VKTVYTKYLVTGQALPPLAPTKAKPLAITIPDWVLPLLVGTFILGAFVWTPIGRKIAISPIAKGAKVSEKKVESWMKAGEK